VEPPSGNATPRLDEPALIGLVEATLRDLHPGAPGLPPVLWSSRLDRDLGFDSLARTELLLRIEREFARALPEDTLQRAETVADLRDALRRASPAIAERAPAPGAIGAPAVAGGTGAPAGAALGDARTLLDALDAHVEADPARIQVICLVDQVEHPITYRQLAATAAAIAGGLQRAGVQPRQTVALMLPTAPEYFGTYFGVLRAGAIPVPIYPPARASQLEDHVLRHAGILANAQATMLVTVPEATLVARLLQARLPGLRQVTTPQQLAAGDATPVPVAVRADDIAFIQYTSGSTGNPKGVALTHANLLANIRAMAQAAQATTDDVFVSWLPLYHDMGLIGAWLAGLVLGFPSVVMSPLAFLARPLRWLQAIHRYRGTLSAGPNFAYELCLKRIDEADLAGLDLSCWRLAFNGAEAVSPDTVRRFAQRMAPCGLRPQALAPVYGLAEACVGLLFPPLGRLPPVDAVRREPLAASHRALPASPDDAHALRFVGCGRPLPGHEIRIVDEAGQPVGDRVEGQLEFRGPSATQGYYRNPRQTELLFHDGWLATGDRAYQADGEVYVTGRVKDIVIRGGRNLYPEEIEQAVGAVDGVRKGCVAVFGCADAASGTEQLVVLAEVRPGDAAAQARWRSAIANAVVGVIGEPPDRIVLAPPHTVLKTSSGKIRRSACRALVESGRVGTALPGPARQLFRLALGAIGPQLRGLGTRAATAAFAAYAWLVVAIVAPLAWLAIALTPDVAAAWRIARAAVRLLLAATATPLRVRGVEQLPARPCVLVSNHGSYVDGAMLVAALARPFAFVAKIELQRSVFTRVLLTRLGAVFVERFDLPASLAAADRWVGEVAAGRSLAVFPEGTFVARPGLLPFHLGAFLVAARAGVPVVPVTLRGQRRLLPDGSWWPRRAALEVEIHPPLGDSGGDPFAAAVRLRDAARRAIGAEAEAV
jgi:1-acyl-sn-glycerol-3-phosphate acyltransferase